VPYTRNNRLVRGLDYYTRTTFEFTTGASARKTPCSAAAATTVSAKPSAAQGSGIGFAMGEDRLVLTLQALDESPSSLAQKLNAFIAPLGEQLNPPPWPWHASFARQACASSSATAASD